MMTFDDAKKWHNHKMLETVKRNLEKRDFQAVILNNKDEVKEFIEKKISPDNSVGLGGSVTTRELEIDTFLKSRGNRLYNHWDESLTKDEILQTRKNQLQSDYFITGINALTIEGQIVNIDGIGNRVASMIFGPEHVIALAGMNKIVRNIHEAIWRIKNISTPRNCRRLNIESPCAQAGYCVDCDSKTSICRITTIIESRPSATDFTVVLLPMELGF